VMSKLVFFTPLTLEAISFETLPLAHAEWRNLYQFDFGVTSERRQQVSGLIATKRRFRP